jgi:hypothetical protein
MAIKPSMFLVTLLLLSHLLATTVVLVAKVPLTFKLVVSITILLSLSYHLARDALLLLPDSWREISVDQGSVSVVTRGGSGFSGEVVNRTFVTPYFVALHVSRERPSLPVFQAIFPDMLGIDEFRGLCVRLRFSQ